MQKGRILGIQPLSPEWFRYRWGRITGTDVAAILGVSSYKTPMEVWARVTGKTACPDFDAPPEEPEPFHLRRGRLLEEPCAQMYAEETGFAIANAPGLIQDAELDWLCVTPDRGIEAHPMPGGSDTSPNLGVLECKAPGHFKANDWDSQVPTEFRIQLQLQLRVWGRAWGAVAALLPDDFRHRPEERNEEFLEKVLGYVIDWRRKYVVGDTPPPPMLKDDKLVRSLLPESVEQMVVLPASMAVLAHEDNELKRFMGLIKKRRSAIRTGLMLVMGESRYADAGDGLYIKRNTIDVQHKAKEAYLEEGRTTLLNVKKEPEAVDVVGPSDDVSIVEITQSLGVDSLVDQLPEAEALDLPDTSANTGNRPLTVMDALKRQVADLSAGDPDTDPDFQVKS
ncbi:MAG: YqaJ viral recombinase family protein [bacterium]|nr:YqaJ viral recombinase family protein [bacterium]